MSDLPVLFRIRSISVLEFHLQEPEEPLVQDQEFVASVRLGFQANKDKRLVRVVLNAEIQKDQGSPILMSAVTAMEFELKDDHAFVTDKVGAVGVPQDVLQPLASLTYSTSRGIMYAKAGSSKLANFILPPLPASDLVTPPLPDSAE